MRGTAAAARRAGAALAALAFAGTAALACTAAHAQGAQAILAVTVTVPRHTAFRIAQPASVTVSEEDVARGYAEVATPVELLVQSNVPQGYTLAFQRQGELVREVQVQGLGEPLVVAEAAALASRPAAGRGMWRDVVTLRFRFALAAGAQPGVHAWPVQVSLMAQ